MIKTISMMHIGVFMTDPEKAAAWYSTHMDFKVVGDFTTAGGHRAIFITSDSTGVTYELVGQPRGSELYASLLGGPADIAHIAYEVEDVEAAFAQAQAEGLDIDRGITDLPSFWANGYRYFMVRTATGEIVEFGREL